MGIELIATTFLDSVGPEHGWVSVVLEMFGVPKRPRGEVGS